MGAAAASVLSDASVDDERWRRSNGVADGDGLDTRWPTTSVPTTEHVKRAAAMDRSRVDDTALLFRRGAAGCSCRCRARAVKVEQI